MQTDPAAVGPPLRPLEAKDIPALAGLTRANREFLAPTSPLRPEQYFTDEGQERAALESLQAAENGTALPMVIVDAAGSLVGTLNFNSIIRGASSPQASATGSPKTEMVRASHPQR